MTKLELYKNDGPPNPEDGHVPLPDLAKLFTAKLTDPESGAVDLVAEAINQAVHHRASDIHFEPWTDCIALRFRIDGALHEIARLPKEHQTRIVARIKILAKMVTYEKDAPQEGRIDGKEMDMPHAMRVSTIPTVDGEKTVIRILDASDKLLRLNELGFQPDFTEDLRDSVLRPQGTVLLTGPSSSGKTTTIYTLLRELKDCKQGSAHIVTIEDPVEYRLREIAQTEVNAHTGFTFATALRSLLRQDPEVIMVGEIRDEETAKAAIQAGLTGHLVISTIHSGTAAGVFARLIDMGVEPFLIGSSVTCVLAQRLVRMNCRHCLVQYEPAPSLLESWIGPQEAEADPHFFKGAGCRDCQGIGYIGRTAIGELLRVNENLAELILERPRTRKIHEQAVRDGMLTLAQDAVRRALAGQTTLEEVQTVLPAACSRNGRTRHAE